MLISLLAVPFVEVIRTREIEDILHPLCTLLYHAQSDKQRLADSHSSLMDAAFLPEERTKLLYDIKQQTDARKRIGQKYTRLEKEYKTNKCKLCGEHDSKQLTADYKTSHMDINECCHLLLQFFTGIKSIRLNSNRRKTNCDKIWTNIQIICPKWRSTKVLKGKLLDKFVHYVGMILSDIMDMQKDSNPVDLEFSNLHLAECRHRNDLSQINDLLGTITDNRIEPILSQNIRIIRDSQTQRILKHFVDGISSMKVR